MSLKPQLSFSAGELDPILNDRVTLERFQNAAATIRNTMVGKTGTLVSRFSKFHFAKAKFDNAPIRLYSPPASELLLEIGYDPDGVDTYPSPSESYIRIYDFGGNLLFDTGSGGNIPIFLREDLPHLHFETIKNKVYIFGGRSNAVNTGPSTIELESPWTVENNGEYFEIPETTVVNSFVGTVGGTGYDIEYAWTVIFDGEETEAIIINASPVFKKPINVGEVNEFTVVVGDTPADIDSFNQVRIYQRPKEGSAFGFLGVAANPFVNSGKIKVTFKDVGANPDYGNSLQSLVTLDGLSNYPSIFSTQFSTGIYYQQRLLLGNAVFVSLGSGSATNNPEAIIASRPGYPNNFFRDSPYSANSALNFKAGSSGRADVLRMIDSDGLVVFTKMGVFAHTGILSPDNIVLVRRGKWVIDRDIPPLVVTGGLFFVDKITSTVRQLVYSQEASAYDALEQSIFSGHLFKNRTIKSWCFQDGVVPLIIVTFSDGKFASFTYSNEHQLKAWTRHDSVYPVEQVEGTGISDVSFFVTNKNGDRYIEGTVPRYVPSSVSSINPEAEMTAYGAFMDALKVKVDLLNDDLVGTDRLYVTPVSPDDWDGPLILRCGTSGIFTSGNTPVGTILRFFHPIDHSFVDLEVTVRTNNNQIVVEPSEEFPEDYSDPIRLYYVHTTVTGLDHLEGEEVSVKCDGSMVSSPYNDNAEDGMTILTVVGGEIDLPESSAITVVGRPIVADTKTLNISTVEQSPTMIESMNVNKLYIRVFNTIGLFVSNRFPEEEVGEVDGNSVKGMQTLCEMDVPSGTDIIANRAKQPVSKRIELTLPGEWDSNGQMSLRQVDPFHFEILSIIADLEVLRRSDR